MIDLAAERQRAREKRETRDEEMKLDMRARRLRLESKAATLEEGASEIWPEKEPEERRNIVARAREQLQERRMDKQEPGKVLTGPEMIELGAEVFRREPKASSDRVYDALEREHGAAALGVSRASWVSVYARQARRAAGVEAPNVAARNKARAKKNPAPKKKHKPAADHPWKQRAKGEVAEAKASTPLEEKETHDEVATEEPSEAERPGEATDSSAGAELAEPVASPASVGEQPRSRMVAYDTAEGHVRAGNDEAGRMVLEMRCPGLGHLVARESGDAWAVSFEGQAATEVVQALVKALSHTAVGGRAA